jgi:hypothetical protein
MDRAVAGVEDMIRIHRILLMKPEKKKPYLATGRKKIYNI